MRPQRRFRRALELALATSPRSPPESLCERKGGNLPSVLRSPAPSCRPAGHAFIQNLRRGFYDLGTDVPAASRLADAFAELALVI